jgi:hypothetical protein
MDDNECVQKEQKTMQMQDSASSPCGGAAACFVRQHDTAREGCF